MNVCFLSLLDECTLSPLNIFSLEFFYKRDECVFPVELLAARILVISEH